MNRYSLILSVLLLIACGDRDDEQKSVDEETPVATSAPFRWGHFGAVLPCSHCEKRRLNTMLWSTGSALVRDEHVNTPNGTELEHLWGKWRKDEDVISMNRSINSKL
jgi:hypothetical protein